jgi:hypothetical protein
MADHWSIGIYSGSSPLSLGPHAGLTNPVLTAADVTDVDAEFVADPFLINHERGWFMFFEVLNVARGRALPSLLSVRVHNRRRGNHDPGMPSSRPRSRLRGS